MAGTKHPIIKASNVSASPAFIRAALPWLFICVLLWRHAKSVRVVIVLWTREPRGQRQPRQFHAPDAVPLGRRERDCALGTTGEPECQRAPRIGDDPAWIEIGNPLSSTRLRHRRKRRRAALVGA